MVFRALGCITLVVSLAGCATPSTTFLVESDGAYTVVYRPGTFTGPGRVTRLQLPWVDVGHCTNRGLNFEVENLAWSVHSPVLSGTFAELPEATVNTLVQGEQGLRKILESTPVGPACTVQVRSDAPSSLRDLQNGMTLLKLLVAERLPMRTMEAWQDQYDFDNDTKSLNILPGMRLRLNHETAIVTDTTRTINNSHAGALAAPVYLHLLAGGADGSKGTWTPTLDRLGFAARNVKGTDKRFWFSASGINELAGEQPHFWRLYVPWRLIPPRIHPYTVETFTTEARDGKSHIPAEPGTQSPQGDPDKLAQGVLNIKEMLDPTTDEYGAFLLLGAEEKESVLTFNREVVEQGFSGACDRLTSVYKGACFVFRYRAIPVPEIPVTIQGELRWVEVGTTLRDVVQGLAARRLRNYMASPTSSIDGIAHSDYEDVGRILQDALVVDVLRGMSYTRRFAGAPARIEPKQGDANLSVLLDIFLQIGDEIKW
jgi:hypothetical protein